MIQDVKLGTHIIGTYMYAINKCAFLLGFRFENKFKKPAFLRRKSSKSQIMWVWKGVWPQEGLK